METHPPRADAPPTGVWVFKRGRWVIWTIIGLMLNGLICVMFVMYPPTDMIGGIMVFALLGFGAFMLLQYVYASTLPNVRLGFTAEGCTWSSGSDTIMSGWRNVEIVEKKGRFAFGIRFADLRDVSIVEEKSRLSFQRVVFYSALIPMMAVTAIV